MEYENFLKKRIKLEYERIVIMKNDIATSRKLIKKLEKELNETTPTNKY